MKTPATSAISPDELSEAFVQALIDPERGPSAWRSFLNSWVQNCDAISEALRTLVPEADRITLLTNLLIPILRNGFQNDATALALFDGAQSMGAHLMPVHFYSPVPDTSNISTTCWEERFDLAPGWDLRDRAQLNLLAMLGAFAEELEDLRNTSCVDDPHAFDWSKQNRAFNPTDAALYYSMIRHFEPTQVLEIGSGHSTRIAAKACLRLRPKAVNLTCIEPYPPSWLSADIPGVSVLSAVPVQEVPVSRFKTLRSNDILFIDCSHICKIGSDVNYLFFHVLPELAPGVIVHLHDIFLPWNFPREWVLKSHCFWNEQYLLLAWLHGNANFEILLASHFLGRVYPEHVSAIFPFLNSPGGSSFWIRRKA